jgi:dTDP-4-dehydrorhamnose reductase
MIPGLEVHFLFCAFCGYLGGASCLPEVDALHDLSIMKILITGAGGLVGHHLANALDSGHQVLALKRADLDITDRDAVKRFVNAEQPSLIVNCAVWGVDECETDSAAAEAINVSGPRNLAESCAEINAELLHFSSNYVFDGERTDGREYTVEDSASPINVYGQTKLDGERIVTALSPRSYIIRTSWVFGSGKAAFLSSAYHKLTRRQRIRAISNTWACVTYVDDLVNRTKDILALGNYGIYHVVNAGACSYYEFAVECARLSGLSTAQKEQSIERITESEMRRLAPRPRWTPMSCLLSARLGMEPMRDWHSALADYVNQARRREQ